MGGVQRGDCLWEAPSFTLEMLFDYLSGHGFVVAQRPTRVIRFCDAVSLDEFAAMMSSEEGEVSQQAVAPSVPQTHLVVFESNSDDSYQEGALDALRKACEMGLPVLASASENYPMGYFEDSLDNLSSAFSLVLFKQVEDQAAPCRDTLLHLVLRFLLDKRSLVNRLSMAAGERGSFQSLVNVAEDLFGCFVNITDAHYRLLACAKRHQPDDEINKSLVDLGYHCEEHLRRQHTMGYLLKSVAGSTMRRYGPLMKLFPII